MSPLNIWLLLSFNSQLLQDSFLTILSSYVRFWMEGRPSFPPTCFGRTYCKKSKDIFLPCIWWWHGLCRFLLMSLEVIIVGNQHYLSLVWVFNYILLPESYRRIISSYIFLLGLEDHKKLVCPYSWSSLHEMFLKFIGGDLNLPDTLVMRGLPS